MPAYVACVRGQLGWFTSQGMDVLCNRLRQIPNVKADIFNWDQPALILNALKFQHSLRATPKLAYCGFSLGATHGPHYLAEISNEIELLVGIDPSQRNLVDLVPSNVKRAICYYNRLAIWLGGVPYRSATMHIENNAWFSVHLAMDWDPKIQQRIIDEVTAIAA